MMRQRYLFLVTIFLLIYLISYLLYFSPNDDDNPLEENLHTQSDCFDPNRLDPNEERFMTYLPHSGFHNQRVSLENAIFLSWVLNRTLIMPPILFSKKNFIPHRPYHILYDMLNGNLTNNIQTCKRRGVEDPTCRFTQLDWEELMDFDFIKKHVRYVHRQDENFDEKELYSYLKITNPESQVYTLAEETRYDFQFYDDETISQVSDQQFKYLVRLCSLRNRDEKLLHFGSIYHLLRFNLRYQENIEFLQSVRESMIIDHPILMGIGERISQQLGGLGTYIGVHLRLGDHGLDKKFGEKAEENVNRIVRGLSERIERSTFTSSDVIDPLTGGDFVPTDTVTDAEKCLQSISPEQRHFPIIYLASDKPRKDLRLKRFFRAFPCVFMLNTNFERYLDPLRKVKNPRDGALLFRYFVPFIDGIVAARGGEFHGTPESTFSDYVYRLHDHWIGS